MSEHQPYYGKVICRDQQQLFIQNFLKKYKGIAPTEDLRKKVYDDLMKEKHLGNVAIPFKVSLNKDESGHGVDYIDILLDTKV